MSKDVVYLTYRKRDTIIIHVYHCVAAKWLLDKIINNRINVVSKPSRTLSIFFREIFHKNIQTI